MSRTPRSARVRAQRLHSRSKRTWSATRRRPRSASQSSIQYPWRSRNASISARVDAARRARRAAPGERREGRGRLVRRAGRPSGGPSGSTCHHDCPASASQSTKRYASSPSRPPGSEVGWSRTPLRALRFMRLRPCRRTEIPHDAPAEEPARRASRSRTSGRARLRPLPGQAHRRRPGRGLGDVFRDGHDMLRAAVRYQPPGARAWREAPLEHARRSLAGTFEPTGPAAGSSSSRRGSTASRRGGTSSSARSRRARRISPASSSEGAVLLGARVAHRRGGARRRRPATARR